MTIATTILQERWGQIYSLEDVDDDDIDVDCGDKESWQNIDHDDMDDNNNNTLGEFRGGISLEDDDDDAHIDEWQWHGKWKSNNNN